jgi:hypothetical protein
LVVEAGEASRGRQIHVKELAQTINDENNNVIAGPWGNTVASEAPVAVAA